MLVFLSHSGSDTDAAKALKDRIAAAPAAREAGLEVWLDIDELVAGDQWQPALEDALERADAFLVYVGAQGVVNWVDREVRHALTRATGPGAIPFLPVLASNDLEPSILPPFVRQFQAVTDPLGDDRALASLIAGLAAAPDRDVILTDRPFVGLTAMGEAEADRFFGRDAETAELTDLLRRHSLVAVVADSGGGKSSLVRAGLVPAFRGGALLPETELVSPVPRHVVVMRPGADPVQGLKDGVDRAARALGRDAGTRRALRQSVRADDPGETFYALACDIDHDAPDILLVIDQFEELLTATPPDAAAAFVRLLLGLVDAGSRRIRAVLTVRGDYVNLIGSHKELAARLEADNGAAQFRLKRMTDDGLDQIVKRPLVMAGHRDAAERDALAAAIRRDITDRPGDLALVQMALYATWRRAAETGADLMTAYTQVNGVLGALAHQAEETLQRLDLEDRAALLPLCARLVRLGDTGGATRRIATLSDLGERRATLARKLATEEAGRLLMIGDDSVEIAHEALVQQWPWLQKHIQAAAEDIRTLARLGDRTAAWQANGSRALPNDIEREAFDDLAQRHDDWLTDAERACLAAARRKAMWRTFSRAAAFVTVIGFGVAMALLAWQLSVAEEDLERSLAKEVEAREAQRQAAVKAENEAQRATAALAEAARNAAGGLVALATIAANEARWQDAIKLALAAWPRAEGTYGVQLRDPIDTLSRALPALREPKATGWPTENVKAEFSPDGRHNVYQPSGNAPFELRRTDTGEVILSDQTYPHGSRVAFSADGRFFSASSQTGRIWLVNLQTGEKTAIAVSTQNVTAVAFSRDGETLYAALPNGLIFLYRTADPGRPIDRLKFRREHAALKTTVTSLAASPDGEHLALGYSGGMLDVWNVNLKLMIARNSADYDETLQYVDDGQALVAFAAGTTHFRFQILYPLNLTPLKFTEEIVWPQNTPDRGLVASLNAISLTDNPIYLPTKLGTFSIDVAITEIDLRVPQNRMAGFQPGRTVARLSTEHLPAETSVHSIEVSPDRRRLAIADASGRLGVWSLEQGTILADYDFSIGAVQDLAFLDETSLAVVNEVGKVRIIDLADTPDAVWWSPPEMPVHQLALSSDWTRMVARAGEYPVRRVRGVPSGRLVAKLTNLPDDAEVILSREGARAAARYLETLWLFDLTNAPEVPEPRDIAITGSGPVDLVAFSDDGRVVAIAGGSRAAGFVEAYDTDTGDELLNATYQRTAISPDIRFSEDSAALRVETGFSGESIWFALDGSNAVLETAPELPDVNPVRDFLDSLASGQSGGERGVLTPDKTRLAVLNDGKIEIFDTATGTVLARLSDRTGDRRLVAIQFPDPATLHAVTDDGRIGTWNLADIAEGNAFDVACRMLDNADLEEALRGYPIVVSDPICGPSYDPPLPEWIEAAHAAIGLAR